MESKKTEGVKVQLIDQLKLLAKKNTFLTIDDILNHPNANNLPLDELDRICEALLNQGININLSSSVSSAYDNTDNVSNDRSRIDYDEVFNRVIKIENSLDPYISEIRQIPFPKSNEEKQLLIQAREGNSYARNRIISMFLKVVVRIALWYYDKYSLSLCDTIQDGNVGLLIALEKMPLSPDYRFSTYAPWWIRQNIDRNASHNFNEAFCFPFHLQERLVKLVEIQKTHYCNSCEIEFPCPNLIDSISQNLSIDKKTVITYLGYVEEPISIEDYIDRIDNDSFLYEKEFQNDDSQNYLVQEQIQAGIAESLNYLSIREAEIIRKRYGIGIGEPMTLEEIASDFKVTRERIRQIEAKAIGKLRHPTRKGKLANLL